MRVQLSLHATKLPNVAGALKGTSDPFAVVTHVSMTENADPVVIGKTEMIKNSLNPEWAKVFVFDYELGKPMHVAVSIYDEVRKGDNKSMGMTMFEIGAILGSRGNTKAKKMKGGGTIFAHVTKSEGSGVLRLQMKALKLKNTEGFMRKSDPFFELLSKRESAGGAMWDNVYRSKVVKDNLSPTWGETVVDLSSLCNGDMDRPIKVAVFDYESSGKHVPMGELETTVNDLLAHSGTDDLGKAFSLTKKGKETGKMMVTKAEVAGVDDIASQMEQASVSRVSPAAPATVTSGARPSFVDYVSGGCDLNLCVAIDFTGSNGDPRKPGTLHYLHTDGSKNDYEKAISAIGAILAKYDSNQQFPVWGFGAKYDGVVRHCFQCGAGKEVQGVDGILGAYRDVFKSGLIMSGPTIFSEVIETAATHAKSAQEQASAKGEQAFTILLILTDGSVTDVGETQQCMDRVSDSPMSVVIVGVGNADFSAMRFLDDGKGQGKRDIAQFVEFNAHSHNRDELTTATLDEIPGQLVDYFHGNGIKPLPPISRGDEEIVVEAVDEEIDLSLDFGGDGEIVVAAGGKYENGGF